MPAELANQLREPRDILGYQQRLRSGERVFQIPDLAATEAYRAGNPLTKLAVEAGSVRTAAFVSLVKDATAIGNFTIARKEVRPFTDKQIVLAYLKDGKPLDEKEGPYRIVIPGEKRMARWVRQAGPWAGKLLAGLGVPLTVMRQVPSPITVNVTSAQNRARRR